MSFSNTRGTVVPKTVCVSRVITEQQFLQKSCDLEDSLVQGKLAEFCERKIGDSSDSIEKNIWSFLKVNPVLVDTWYIHVCDLCTYVLCYMHATWTCN